MSPDFKRPSRSSACSATTSASDGSEIRRAGSRLFHALRSRCRGKILAQLVLAITNQVFPMLASFLPLCRSAAGTQRGSPSTAVERCVFTNSSSGPGFTIDVIASCDLTELNRRSILPEALERSIRRDETNTDILQRFTDVGPIL